MRKALLVVTVLLAAGLVPQVAADHGPNELLNVDDGSFFYDSDGDCVGDTDDHTQGQALRHWHVGVPLVPAQAEPAGGFGCGEDWEPQTWQVTVSDGHVARVSGEVTYIWDQNVPGGGFNDVQIHIRDARGALVYSTLEEEGVQPVDPTSPAPLTHTVDTTLEPGTYTIEEDIFSGEHTTWLTNLDVVEEGEVSTQG